MRQVNIKQLNKHLSAELANIPFEITKNGKVIAVVTGKSTNNDIKTSKPTTSHKKTIATKYVEPIEDIINNKSTDNKKATIPTGGSFFNPRPKKGKK